MRRGVKSSFNSPYSVFFLFNVRNIIQSNSGKGLRSIVEQFDDWQLKSKLRKNGRGNYYRYQQKLWPCAEKLERELTEKLYGPTERTPLILLPKPKQTSSSRHGFIFEGHGTTVMLEEVEKMSMKIKNEGEIVNNENSNITNKDSPNSIEGMLSELIQSDQSINSKILTDNDLEGTILESGRERARNIIKEDLQVNSLISSSSSSSNYSSYSNTTNTNNTSLVSSHNPLTVMQRIIPSATDEGGSAWSALKLDPLLSKRALEKYGPSPTRLQCRLLPALLHEDHNDILFNGVTGSGKTSALLLALLQSVRSESAGINIFVANDTMTAMRAYDQLRSLCGNLGGTIVDRPQNDFSWLFMGIFPKEYENYYNILSRSIDSEYGPVRIFITTADTMCELLFEKKMEFEPFGYLRRVYVDDIGVQIPMLPPNAPVKEMRERLRNPLPCELLLGTLHQLPGPHIRSILQLGLVSADMNGELKDHLKSLCVKLERHTIVLSPVRIPSTIHCLFSFYLHYENVYEYMTKLIWNAKETIPGRAIIFIRYEDNLLDVRTKLRGLGMNVKIFSEIYYNGEFRDNWKFLLLKESEAFGIDLPLVSHVFITFCPHTTCSFQHMCGRTGRLGNVGWVYTITDKREAKSIREIASQLEVNFTEHVIDENLKQISPKDVERQTKEYELYGLDPQYAVKQHYIVQSENPDLAYKSREFFSKPVNKQFQMEQYTPIPVLHRRFINANKLATDINRDPSIVVSLQKQGLLNPKFTPTQKLKKLLNNKSRKNNASVYDFGKSK